MIKYFLKDDFCLFIYNFSQRFGCISQQAGCISQRAGCKKRPAVKAVLANQIASFSWIKNEDGYDLVRKDRKRTGGAVAMYFRNSISYKTRQDIMPESLETIMVEVTKRRAKQFFLNTWYKPPCRYAYRGI